MVINVAAILKNYQSRIDLQVNSLHIEQVNSKSLI